MRRSEQGDLSAFVIFLSTSTLFLGMSVLQGRCDALLLYHQNEVSLRAAESVLVSTLSWKIF